MAYFRCGGGGMPAGLQSGMDAVLNKKFGTSTTYPASGWPDNVNLMGPLPEKTVSGAIASFSDGADDVPTKSLIVTIPASLSGVSSVSETQSDGDEYEHEYTASLGRTIYGGEVDIVNGEGVEAWKSVKLKDLNWTYSTAYGGFFRSSSLVDIVSSDSYICLSSEYTNMRLNSSAIQNNDDVICINADNGSAITGAVVFKGVVLKDSDYSTKEALVAHLTSSDSTLVYKVATPTDFTFTGQEVPTRLGYNAFWSDEGDTEVTYRRDIDLALGGN